MKTQTEQELKQMRKDIKKIFPVVMKNKDGILQIIYRNRTEIYKLSSKDKCDGYEEIQMAKGSGLKRVRDETENDWRFKE